MRISDWSSDVCSSDLRRAGTFRYWLSGACAVQLSAERRPSRIPAPGNFAEALDQFHHGHPRRLTVRIAGLRGAQRGELVEAMLQFAHLRTAVQQMLRLQRSDKRRVGKEWVSTCRSRW